MQDPQIKEQVQRFYNQVGWQLTDEGFYQNARYEDLRPVSSEYVRRCHLRVARFLRPQGTYLLDAGSGPIQYPEYLAYSLNYRYRVCVDISIVALQEARKRIGERGLFVVADVANLPFAPNAFDSAVSLHTFHHLPVEDQQRAYHEVYRVLAPGAHAVIVNGWTDSALMRRTSGLVRLMETLGNWVSRKRAPSTPALPAAKSETQAAPKGTYIHKQDVAWLRKVLIGKPFEIRCWRSVSVRFLRAVIHAPLGGKYWLRLLYRLEELYPRWFGENGQYPLVVLHKVS